MFLAGKDDAIARIYTQFLPLLYNYGRNVVNNESLVGDCIQDFFTELIDKRDKLSAATSVKLYLITCLRRKLLRQISRNKKLVSENFSEQDGFIFGIDPEVIQLTSRYDSDEKKIIEQACIYAVPRLNSRNNFLIDLRMKDKW
jgi:RNA polymerase sigma factor (sigma-70 family)